MQLPTLSLAVPAGNNFIYRHISNNRVTVFNYLSVLSTDEEYKLNKVRLSEVVERSIPSHVYIFVSIKNFVNLKITF